MDAEEYYEDIHEFFEDFPERFILTSEELDPTLYEEYVDFQERVHDEYHTEESILQESEQLFEDTPSFGRKKALLVLLAQMGTVQTYRRLERFVAQASDELRAWGLIALYECRVRMESDLLETEVGLISTGLGGQAHRLRYVVIVGLVFADVDREDRQCVLAAFQEVCQAHDSELEQLEFHERYIQAALLVSMHVPVGTVIDECVDAVNEKRLLLRQKYYVTNVKQPTEDDIHAYLQEIHT